MSLAAPDDGTSFAGVGGIPPNLIDVAPGYDFVPGTVAAVPEVPWAPLILLGGAAAVVAGRRRVPMRRVSRTRRLR
jgi:hypothetical protein